MNGVRKEEREGRTRGDVQFLSHLPKCMLAYDHRWAPRVYYISEETKYRLIAIFGRALSCTCHDTRKMIAHAGGYRQRRQSLVTRPLSIFRVQKLFRRF